jgi:uncharacterized protein YjgD (DUF1641 family)
MPDDTTPMGTEAGIMRLAQAASESLTDGMVERLAITGANALEVVDMLNEEDTKDAVISLMEKLTAAHKLGALDTGFELLTAIHGVRNAMTDSMVERAFIFVEHMVNNLATEEMADLAHNAKEAMASAAESSAKEQPTGGLLSAISMLSKPESQQALQFLMAFACKMRALSVEEKS